MKKMICFCFPLLLCSCGFRSSAGWFNEGNVAYTQERWKEAGDCYRRALDGRPDNRTAALIYYNRANTAVKEAVALTKAPAAETAAADGAASAAANTDSGALLKEALELYCLAQQFYGEPFPDAAVNAEWVRLRLKQNEENRSDDNGKDDRQKKEDSRETKNNGDNGQSRESSSDEPSSENGNENNSSQDGENRSEGSTSAGDDSGEQSSGESSGDRQNGSEMQSDVLSANEAQNDPANGENRAEMAENESVAAEEKAESAMSAEEAARMKAAVELLEQEESSRRQRPSFRRLPSYDDTEKNW